jgi:CubicO group peptidase (beta-lactamase class C family)
MRWEDFVQENILALVDIERATYTISKAQQDSDHAMPHDRDSTGRVVTKAWRNVDNIAPAGAINCSCVDLCKWVRFQIGYGTKSGEQVIRANTVRRDAHSSNEDSTRRADAALVRESESDQISYCLVWAMQEYRGHLFLSHGGNIDGFTSRIVILPRDRIGIVVLCNLGLTKFNVALSNSFRAPVPSSLERLTG